jgi:predicted adenine nucleotide alpha hydrolase (AANH) superfamily ATPase
MSSKNSSDRGAKPALLVHVCCGPDAIYAVALLQADHAVTGFFYNPNIDPPEEYDRRLGEAEKVERILDFPLLGGEYDRARWEKAVRAFGNEPEKGRRCDICCALRLDRTARRALEAGIPVFTTIMSISPWKKAEAINRIGRRLAAKYGLRFLEADFKKKGGFEKSVELSRRYGLYRQNFCGCAYGRRPSKGASR